MSTNINSLDNSCRLVHKITMFAYYFLVAEAITVGLSTKKEESTSDIPAGKDYWGCVSY